MNEEPSRWSRVQALFEQAVALPESEREAFLRCSADPALREELRCLLAQDAGADPVGAVVAEAAAGWLQQRADRLVGTRLGPWRLEQHLADGGMGAVYLATRADGQFEQRAAVKLLSPALTSPQFALRLALERQILARLQHPHIASLLDGGTTDDGAPYLVMAFVDGLPIDRHCAERALDTPARLRLVQQVCDAVEHAHRNLVVHRDLKPANILIGVDGQVKLLDFGVAKLVEADDNVATRADQRLLTPRYASPEQLRGQPVTTATDVYALGVLLFELLTGRSPFPADPSTPADGAQLAREILETEPRRPSRVPHPDGVPVPGAIPRELDLVVMKAMHKDPARRYASARALADDLERHLHHQPVSAHADSIAYRAAKFVRRHRVAVPVSAAAVVVVIAAGAVFTAQIDAQRRTALAEAARAERVADFMTDVFSAADPSVQGGKEVTARELLNNAARQVDTELADDPRTLAALRRTIGRAFLGLGLYPEALPHLDEAVKLATRGQGENSPEALRARARRGDALNRLGRYDDAAAELRAVVAAQEGAPPSELAGRSALLLGLALWKQGRDLQGAQAQLQRAVDLAASLGPAGDAQHAHNMVTLADFLSDQGRYDDALRWGEQALARLQQVHGEHHPETVEALRSVGTIQMRREAFPEAIALLERALDGSQRIYAADHPRVAYLRANLANLHHQVGDYARAEALARQAMPVFEKRLGVDHPRTAYLTENLANAVLEQGRTDEALALYQHSLDLLRRKLGPDHVEFGFSAGNMAGVYARMKRFADALPWARESVRVLEAALGGDAPPVAHARAKLAQALIDGGRLDEAERELVRADAAVTSLPAAHTNRLDLLLLRSELTLRRARPVEAEALARQALALERDARPARGTRMAEAQSLLARCLQAQKRHAEAAALLQEAQRGLIEVLGADHAKTVAAREELQRAQRTAGAPTRNAPAPDSGS